MVGVEQQLAIRCGPVRRERQANAKETPRKPMSIFDLTGRVAVVTGGNGGIGLGIAQALAAAGCNVSIWGRNAEKNALPRPPWRRRRQGRHADLRRHRRRLGQGGDDRHARTIRPRRRLLRQCRHRRRRAPRLHRPHRGTVAQHVRHQSRRRVPRVPGRRAPHDRARGPGDAFGRLVATSSLASLFGTARNEHYAATKAAINALVRALAVELARQGVTANAILPGWIKSDMTAGLMANENSSPTSCRAFRCAASASRRISAASPST